MRLRAAAHTPHADAAGLVADAHLAVAETHGPREAVTGHRRSRCPVGTGHRCREIRGVYGRLRGRAVMGHDAKLKDHENRLTALERK